MTPRLKCTECAFENEPERIYCHNCGQKLDRSVLPEPPTPEENVREVRKRVRHLARPAGEGRAFVRAAVGAILSGLVAAGLVQMARPPAGVPPLPEATVVDAPALGLALETLLEKGAGALAVTDAEASGYLFNTIKQKKQGGLSEYIRYKRTFVRFEPGVVWLTTERHVWTWPVFATVGYRVSVSGGALAAEVAGGAVGRLPVHAAVMRFVRFPFASLWQALSRERRLVQRMGAVRFEQGRAVLVAGGAPGPAAAAPAAAP